VTVAVLAVLAEVETAAQAWSPWYVALWVAWGAMFAVLEAAGLRRPDDRLPPLTHVVRRYVPALIVLPGLVWLLWHGLDAFSRPAP
jgi:membrane associated rhomboid family serine protease